MYSYQDSKILFVTCQVTWQCNVAMKSVKEIPSTSWQHKKPHMYNNKKTINTECFSLVFHLDTIHSGTPTFTWNAVFKPSVHHSTFERLKWWNQSCFPIPGFIFSNLVFYCQPRTLYCSYRKCSWVECLFLNKNNTSKQHIQWKALQKAVFNIIIIIQILF